LYVRHFFADDPHFENAKLVFSVYDQKPELLDKDLAKKLVMEGFDKDLLKGLNKPTTDDLVKFAMGFPMGLCVPVPSSARDWSPR
jgi:hypothetical protein